MGLVASPGGHCDEVTAYIKTANFLRSGATLRTVLLEFVTTCTYENANGKLATAYTVSAPQHKLVRLFAQKLSRGPQRQVQRAGSGFPRDWNFPNLPKCCRNSDIIQLP